MPDVVRVSPVYETDPVGGPPDQGPYLNLVVELSTDRSARQLLQLAKDAEAAADRKPTARWGPGRSMSTSSSWATSSSTSLT